jgi:hypothetical protein
MRAYKPRHNLVMDKNGDLSADSHNILNRWKNNFSHLLNVHTVTDVRQLEVHMAEPLMPCPSHLEIETAIAKLKYKSPGSVQILAELIQTGCEILLPAIHKLFNSVWNKEEVPDQWKCLLLYQFTKRVTKHKILSNILHSRLSPYIDEIIGDHQCGL